MRLVVIESPYQADPAKFTAYLAACIKDMLRRGEATMTSVGVYVLTGALNDLDPEDRRQGIAAGLEWYRVAEACVVYLDFGLSKGMVQGMDEARRLNVPIEIRRLYKETQT